MKYAADIGSSAAVYMPDFIKTGSGIQKLKGGDRGTQIRRSHVPILGK
jgi:hypothetical protein